MAKKTSTLDSILNGTYQSFGIEVNKPTTKKKKKEEDIAPIKKQTNDRTWFSSGAFSDGYQFGDVTKTILGTASDITENLYTGALGIGEKTIDTGAYLLGGGAKLFGADNFSNKMQDFIEKDLINEEALAKEMNISNPTGLVSRILNGKQTDENSLLGEKTDSLAQSGGQLAGTYGLSALGVPWWLTTGVTSFGGEVEQAFKEDATYGEAGFSGLVSAGAEILTEKLSGGISFGGNTLDDVLLKPLTEKITNKALQKLTTFGIQATGEGLEEVLTEVISSVGKKLSYEDEKTWEEMLTSEEAMDSYLEAFIGGAVLGGIGSVSQRAVQEAEQELGRPLTDEERAKIEEAVERQQENASNTEVQEDIAPIKEQDDLPNSKVRDKDGKLLTVYHGTRADFDTFDTSKAGQNYQNNWSNNGKGIYFTDNKVEAQEYAESSIDEGSPKIKEAQLDITNPFDSSKDYTNELSDMAKEYEIEPYYLERGDRLFNWFNINNKDIVEALKKYGYDGIVDHGHYTVFDPKQIKNVDNNNKTENNVEKVENKPTETQSIVETAPVQEDKTTSIKTSDNLKDLKQKQLDIILKENPMTDDYHTGIRTIEDIKTFDETINDDESFVWGDFSKEDAKKALEKGEITVYSSYPIEQGVFVSTSKNQAQDYAGGGKVYSKTVPLNEVAWINGDEGQYAKVKNVKKSESIAPIKETSIENDIAPIKQELADLTNELKNTIKETKEELKSLTSEINEAKSSIEDVKALTIDDLPALEQQYNEDFKNIKDTDIAPEGENIGNFIDESIIDVKKKNDITSFIRDMFGIKINEARKLYDKIANLENPTVDDVYEALEDYRSVEYQETLEDKNADELRKRIRNTRIDMSNLKHQITDYNAYRKRNFGNLRLSNSGTPVDVLYQELVETGYFSADVTNEADQLLEIENFMNNRNTTESIQYELSDSDLYTIAEELYSDIGNRERYLAVNHLRGSFINYLKQRGDEIAPVENVEAPVENVENPIENASETQQVEEIASVVERAPTLREVIETEDPIMEYVERRVEREQKKKEKAQQEATIDEDQYANNNVVPKKKPTLKESASRSWDAFQSHFVNRNRQIDKLSKASGNNEIKFKGDRVNNISGEIGGDIFTAQTDNYGNVIGKPLDAPFESARQEGLDSYFDNYLKHKSNIERHAQEKGSAKVSAKTSQKYVEAYESKYPQFIEWSNDVYTFNRNNLNNAVNNGLISNDLRNLFTQMYGNYVPFYATETQDLDPSVYMTPDEIRTSMPVKRAKGGSDTNLLSVEQAMIQQTYAYKNSIAKNDLYKEIGKVINKKIELGADVRQNPLALEDTLYADENGKYLTYYENGKRKTVQITDELYTELNRDLENQIRNLEEKYSLITKPLQKISQIRGQILTTYNPGFVITNPFKDIQDALLNTKNLGKFAKNVLVQSTIRDSSRGKKVNQYATEFKKLTGKDISSVQDANTLKGKAKALFNDYQAGTMWNRFVTSYGTNATSMEFGDNGIDVKAKNKGFFNKIEKANNYMEVMFRYPEFKATLEKGGSFTEALYNAREVTTNFGRGGTISKAINRNGATFFNTSVQGMDKFFRNFSGENGARGFIGAVAKASSIGILPAVLNHLLFGDDDEEYEALPDYIKDNYYLFKIGEGEFIRIPKGRMIAVLGSAGRRTLELASGEENAFEGYLTNASDQIGASNPLKENVFSPLIQAYGSENGEAWYGGDLVPTRLQDKPKAEQFDEGTDEFSKWLGEQLNISPYKLNYVIDQYSGGFGDLILPMITNEAKSDGTLLAPLKDKFVVNSTDDNKYVGELYDLSDELTIKSNSSNATDEDKLKNKYMNAIKSDMSELYKEKREIQNSDLSKEEKYKKVQAIQDQINDLAKEALGDYESVEITDNYSSVGSKEYYKTTEGEWYSINEEELTDLNSMGMTSYEKNNYFGAKNNIYTLKDSYEDRLESATDDEKDSLYTEQKREIIDEVRNSGLTDNIKSYLYDRYYGSTDKLNVITETNIPFDTYLELEYQDFKADKNNKGQTISGSKKKKIMNFIESSDLDYNQKIMLHKIYYPADDKYNYDIADYVFNNVETYETRINILETLGFTIDENGVVHWD